MSSSLHMDERELRGDTSIAIPITIPPADATAAGPQAVEPEDSRATPPNIYAAEPTFLEPRPPCSRAEPVQQQAGSKAADDSPVPLLPSNSESLHDEVLGPCPQCGIPCAGGPPTSLSIQFLGVYEEHTLDTRNNPRVNSKNLGGLPSGCTLQHKLRSMGKSLANKQRIEGYFALTDYNPDSGTTFCILDDGFNRSKKSAAIEAPRGPRLSGVKVCGIEGWLDYVGGPRELAVYRLSRFAFNPGAVAMDRCEACCFCTFGGPTGVNVAGEKKACEKCKERGASAALEQAADPSEQQRGGGASPLRSSHREAVEGFQAAVGGPWRAKWYTGCALLCLFPFWALAFVALDPGLDGELVQSRCRLVGAQAFPPLSWNAVACGGAPCCTCGEETRRKGGGGSGGGGGGGLKGGGGGSGGSRSREACTRYVSAIVVLPLEGGSEEGGGGDGGELESWAPSFECKAGAAEWECFVWGCPLAGVESEEQCAQRCLDDARCGGYAVGAPQGLAATETPQPNATSNSSAPPGPSSGGAEGEAAGNRSAGSGAGEEGGAFQGCFLKGLELPPWALAQALASGGEGGASSDEEAPDEEAPVELPAALQAVHYQFLDRVEGESSRVCAARFGGRGLTRAVGGAVAAGCHDELPTERSTGQEHQCELLVAGGVPLRATINLPEAGSCKEGLQSLRGFAIFVIVAGFWCMAALVLLVLADGSVCVFFPRCQEPSAQLAERLEIAAMLMFGGWIDQALYTCCSGFRLVESIVYLRVSTVLFYLTYIGVLCVSIGAPLQWIRGGTSLCDWVVADEFKAVASVAPRLLEPQL